MSSNASGGALFSLDRAYRYALFRRWEEGRRQLVVIGLNPSTADEYTDDPTIRRCVAFAKRERCSALVMLNLFALRATDPREMKRHPEPIGEGNDRAIETYAWGDDVIVVAAWGAHRHPAFPDRAETVAHRVPHLLCFGLTSAGHPRHPLYLRADTPLVSFSRAPNPTPENR